MRGGRGRARRRGRTERDRAVPGGAGRNRAVPIVRARRRYRPGCPRPPRGRGAAGPRSAGSAAARSRPRRRRLPRGPPPPVPGARGGTGPARPAIRRLSSRTCSALSVSMSASSWTARCRPDGRARVRCSSRLSSGYCFPPRTIRRQIASASSRAGLSILGTECSRLSDSTTMISSCSSMHSSRVSRRTTTPRCSSIWTRPSVASVRKASLTGVVETLNSVATSTCRSRAPTGIVPTMIRSRSSSATQDWVVRQAARTPAECQTSTSPHATAPP